MKEVVSENLRACKACLACMEYMPLDESPTTCIVTVALNLR
jgi:hypothetical protein